MSFTVLALFATVFIFQLLSRHTFAMIRTNLRSFRIKGGYALNYFKDCSMNMDHIKALTSRSIAKSALVTASCLAAAAAPSSFNNLMKGSGNQNRALSAASAATVADAPDILAQAVPTDTATNDEMIKRQNDKKKYEAFTLKNGMRVLLVSDPSSISAAAAVDVHVGSFTDPLDIPGLAHFCEHMSFLGTKKYPKEDAYSTFLSSHGGSSNAYTDSEDTVYYFDINTEYFKESLDRFAQFFVSPLFTASATNRELNAIDSEHAKNINDDGFRLYQLEKDFAYPSHPLHKFATGNKETLLTIPKQKNINVRQALLDFHAKYYSGNQMTLCVYGSQDLATLKKWTQVCFEAVKNTKVASPSDTWWGRVPPVAPQAVASVAEVVPINEMRRLSLNFPVFVPNASVRQSLLRLKPEMVVAHLLGHEGHGSVCSYLKQKNWANSIYTAVSIDISDLQMMEIAVELTEEGLLHRYEVADAIFAYLQLLRSPAAMQSLKAYILDEVSQLSHIGFEYSENSEPIDFVSSLVADMQMFRQSPPREYLYTPHVYPLIPTEAVRQELLTSIDTYLQSFAPSQCRVRVVSQSFKGQTDSVAPYYGTEYNTYTLPEQTKRWEAIYYALSPSTASLPTSPVSTSSTTVTTTTVAASTGTENKTQKETITKTKTTITTTRLYENLSKANQLKTSTSDYSTSTAAAVSSAIAGKFSSTSAANSECVTAASLGLSLPTPNQLIPHNFQLITNNTPISDTMSEQDKKLLLNIPPTLILDNDRWKMYHKVDSYYSQPKAYFVASLAIPQSLYTPAFVVHSKLFTCCFLDSINEYLYDARLAGLSFQLDLASKGLQITFSGYNDKLAAFVTYILQALKTYQPDVNTFNRYKDSLEREFKSWKTQQPYFHASYYANLVSETLQFEISDLQKALEQQTRGVEVIQNHFIQSLLQTSHGVGLIIGNIDDKDALKMVASIDKVFPFKPLEKHQRCIKKTFELPLVLPSSSSSSANNNNKSKNKSNSASVPASAGGYRLSNPEPNTNDDNSAVTFYFQQPSREMTEYLLVELLADVIEQPFYNELRTQQQLGYIVYSGVKTRQGINHLLLTAQSSIADGYELTKRIETSVTSTLIPFIKALTEDTYDEFKQGMIARKSEPDRRLTAHASRFWTEILLADSLALTQAQEVSEPLPQFDRHDKECLVLESIGLAQFKAFAMKFLTGTGVSGGTEGNGNSNSGGRRLLISQINTAATAKKIESSIATTTTTASDMYTEIPTADIRNFSSSLKTL